MDERTADRTPDNGQAADAGGFLSAREAAAVLGVNERTIRRAIARGALPAIKQAGTYRIATGSVTGYRTRHQPTKPARLIPCPRQEGRPQSHSAPPAHAANWA